MKLCGPLAFVALAVLVALSPAASATGPTVFIEDNRFVPAKVTVAVGEKVTWELKGRNQHTVTFDDGPHTVFTPICAPTCGQQSFSTSFRQAGIYPYHCSIHGVLGMTGVVEVVEPILAVAAAGPPSVTRPREAPPPRQSASSAHGAVASSPAVAPNLPQNPPVAEASSPVMQVSSPDSPPADSPRTAARSQNRPGGPGAWVGLVALAVGLLLGGGAVAAYLLRGAGRARARA